MIDLSENTIISLLLLVLGSYFIFHGIRGFLDKKIQVGSGGFGWTYKGIGAIIFGIGYVVLGVLLVFNGLLRILPR